MRWTWRQIVAFVFTLTACVSVLVWLTPAPQPERMTEATFWALIERLNVQDWDDRTTDYAPLRDGLLEYPPEDIAAFYEILVRKTHALDTRAHYAAYSFTPGMSDSFLYSRLAVVARGKAFYEAVLRDPSKFPGWSKGAWFEYLMYVPGIAFQEKTGETFDRVSSVSVESFSNSDGWNSPP